jgi:tetratricopeptide (TPR) repeat protein
LRRSTSSGEVRLRRIATEDDIQQNADYWLARADRYEERGDLEAAVKDLAKAVDLGPLGVSDLLKRRTAFNIRLERWREAALDYERHVQEYGPSDSGEWQRAVTLHAVAYLEGASEIDDYQRVCNAMIEHLHDSPSLARRGERWRPPGRRSTAASSITPTARSSALRQCGPTVG